MLGLKTKINGFRIILPKDFLLPEIDEKYTKIIVQKKGFFNSAIDLLNESIQRVELFGFNNAALQQIQPTSGLPVLDENRYLENKFAHGVSEFNYRAAINPLMLIDKTFSIEFRHIAGFLNYFMVFENFCYLYSRDINEDELCRHIPVEVYDEHGAIYCRLHILDPIINGLDMIAFDNTQPLSTAMTFKLEFKYSNFEIEFVDTSLKSDIFSIDDYDNEGTEQYDIDCR